MKIKNILFVILLFLCSLSSFSEDSTKNDSSMFVFTMGPIGSLNFHTNSAPSPILFSGGFGTEIEFFRGMSFTPHISFFAHYCLIENNIVYPAEIEHRTAFVPSFIVDIPFTGDMHFNNSVLRIGAGVSFLLRYALLATGTDSTALNTIQEMNTWFWDDLEFLYPSFQLSWDYIFDTGFAFGVGAKGYVPLASLMRDGSLQNGMVSIFARFIPASF